MLCGLGLQAQDIKSLYIALPDSLSPLLTKVNRADFCDFLASNMKAEVKNRFGNVSEMLKLTDDYLSVRISESSREEMKLLPLNDSVKVVCVVRTYLGPVADSKVSFYDTGPAGTNFRQTVLWFCLKKTGSINSLWQRRRQIRCTTCVCMPICI